MPETKTQTFINNLVKSKYCTTVNQNHYICLFYIMHSLFVELIQQLYEYSKHMVWKASEM